jgi:tetratricopeptide (TPR) repeat protein
MAVLIASCSRKKDGFLNRNFHAVTTEYNTLFNGNVALDQGKEALIATFNDNYWDILPVERIAFTDDISLGEENRDPNFLKAEEKAVKAIQKHTMKLDGEERNPQIDEAFMLLGKARYYDKKFVPAIEAFNYILAYYPKSNTIAQAKIWKEKTNIRLENNKVAIDNLLKIFKVEDKLKDQDQADIYAMLSQAYLNLEHKDTALVYIKEASRLTRKNEERGRYNFIKGQLYNSLTFKDSANMAFAEVIDLNRKIPRKYWINAHLEIAKNHDYENEDHLVLLEKLEELEFNRENRPYLDKIYYAKADYFMKTEQIDSALANYNKSLRQNSQDDYLNSRDYLALADYNFDQAAYQVAGAYYDSVMGLLDKRSRELRLIKKKRENLTDVIKYEELAERNDSIVTIVQLPEAEQRKYFEEYIAAQKEKAKQDSIKRSEDIRNNEFFKTTSAFQDRSGGGTVGEFYFYNNTAVAYGKQAFAKRWGKRKLADGWRLSSRQSVPLNGNSLPSLGEAEEEQDVASLNVDDFMALVPREQKQIDSLIKERDFAYFQLGLIYKEKFKEYPLASDRLEKLLTFNPEERLILPAKYNLHQVYKEMNAFAKADAYKSDITSNYPDSRYAAILNNPNEALEEDADSPEVIYRGLYKEFQNQNYGPLLTQLDARIEQFYGDSYLPKFELLKATTLGRYKGYDAYKKALNFIALTYPRTEEGKKAQKLLQTALPSMSFKGFDDAEISVSWKLLYTFSNSDRQGAQSLKKQIEDAFELLEYTNFKTSYDLYNDEQSFVVVHYLSSEPQAQGLEELLRVNPEIAISKPATVIASENYKIVQLHKNLEAYISQQTK